MFEQKPTWADLDMCRDMGSGDVASVLDAIDHVALQVEDIAEAVRWYRQRIQCVVDYQDDTWALLRLANMNLALVVPEQHPPHLAIQSSRAREFGVLTRHRDGTSSCYVEDPGGNVLEILQA